MPSPALLLFTIDDPRAPTTPHAAPTGAGAPAEEPTEAKTIPAG